MKFVYRSSQNLADHRQATLPPNFIGSRQPSNPNLVPNNYNNHHIPYQQPPYQHQQPSPVGENGERFYQNLSIYRNQDIHNGHGPPPQNGIGRGKMPSPQEDRYVYFSFYSIDNISVIELSYLSLFAMFHWNYMHIHDK